MKPPTASQWRAIEPIEPHLLVSAGAGTGKTTTVVAKILYLLGAEIPAQDGPPRRRPGPPLQLRDIAAITYTNRAAADLKAKLRSELREAGLREAAYEVDRSRIGTIHSFCAEVLREFALRGGYAPPHTVLDEGEAQAVLGEAVRETVVDAVAEGAIPGLDELLATWSLRDIEAWVGRLAANADRLQRLRAAAGAHGPAEHALLELAARALARLRERQDAAGAVDFDRMIVDTRDLIRDNAGVRDALRRRLRVLIIDEFQDVDPAQKEIAYLLAEPESGRADTPRLVLVGDPKQSIYRFRRADVTVWRAVERDFAGRGFGRVVELEDNFRSVEPLLAFVESTIGPVLDTPVDGQELRDFEVPFRALAAMRRDAPHDGAVELVVVPAAENGKCRKVAEVRAAEAAAVARRMRQLHEGGAEAPEGAAGPVAWKDMAILLESWGEADRYAAALEREGIPCYVLRSEGFFSRREILDICLALRAVRDPGDDVALIGFLRSPFVGLDDASLLAIARQLRGARPYWRGLDRVRLAEPAALERGRALLRRHVELRDRIPTAELITSLLEESGYLAHLALLGAEGDQALANILQFLRFARSLADGGVGELLRVVAEARARGDRVPCARLYGESDDVVTITSIHSAKGLEWRVVFWCDLVRSPQKQGGDRLRIGRDRIVLGDPDLSASEQSDAWRALDAQEDAEAEAERKRLWYVAATRAKDRLVLGGIPLGESRSGRSTADMLKATLPGIESAAARVAYSSARGTPFTAVVHMAPLVEEATVAAEALVSGDAAAALALPAGLDSLPLPPAPVQVRTGRRRHTATELLARARCPRRHRFRYILDIAEPPVQRSGPAFETAVVRGQIVHDVLEHLREEEEMERLLEAAIGRWAPDAPPPESAAGSRYRAEIRAAVETVRGNAEYAAIADSPDARRELRFIYLHDEEIHAEGAMDLAAPSPGGLVLLDVKTGGDRAGDARKLAAHYTPQRDLYVTAAEGIASRPVACFAFHFSRTGAHIALPVTDEMRAAARMAFEATACEIARGAPTPPVHSAECRFCGYGRAGWCDGATSPGDGEPEAAG